MAFGFDSDGMAGYWEDGKVRMRVVFPLWSTVEPDLIVTV